MPKCKVVVLGREAVGKTSLVCQLVGWGFDRNYKKTIGADPTTLVVNHGLKLDILDVSGSQEYVQQHEEYLKNANIVIYCIDDLNTELTEIQQQIATIKEKQHGVPVILAATKCDTYPNPDQQRLNEIGQLVGSNANIITSAATGQGIIQGGRRLIHLITALFVIPLPLPIDHLLTSLHNGHATDHQREQIRAALTSLANRIQEDNTQTAQATQEFVTRCHTILEGNHPDIMSAVYSLAGAVLVAGIIAVAGLSFGVTVLPVLAASSVGGIVTAGLISNSLFKERKYVSEVLGEFSTNLAEHFTAAPGAN